MHSCPQCYSRVAVIGRESPCIIVIIFSTVVASIYAYLTGNLIYTSTVGINKISVTVLGCL